MSSKFPLVVVLSELSALLRSRGMALDLEWAPRDQNEEADALTNEDYSAFDPAKRISVMVEDINWLVLPYMLGVAGDIYEAVQKAMAVKVAKTLPLSGTTGKHLKLRARGPW
jgi:hypothetical protein